MNPVIRPGPDEAELLSDELENRGINVPPRGLRGPDADLLRHAARCWLAHYERRRPLRADPFWDFVNQLIHKHADEQAAPAEYVQMVRARDPRMHRRSVR
jgi:hypothetical protein